MQLYVWQSEALEKWEKNRFRGIANVVTGAGKTMLAMAAIAKLSGMSGVRDLKVKIIVPKTFLARQWCNALKGVLGISQKDIGVFSGIRKDESNRKYMIYVINSARYVLTRHVMADYGSKNAVFIIADECHHYGSPENARIFDFINIIPNYHHYYALGLSATPYGGNYKSVLEPCLGKEIYRFNFAQALEAGIISRFSILSICVEFIPAERAEYDEISDRLGIALHNLKKHCPQLYMNNSKRFFGIVENIIKTHKNPDVSRLAQTVMLLAYRRKEIVYYASSRVKCVIDLVELIDKNAKIIIFGERIEMAEEIYRRLCATRPGEVGIYHSKLHKDVRKNILNRFEDSQIRILVSCKTLDEGLDVSGADVGIIASSTSSERQRIQRLGRILRKKAGGGQAYFYHLYVKDTMEETEVFDEINDNLIRKVNIIDLYYDVSTGSFLNPFYTELAHTALSVAENKGWDADKISELWRNLEKGVVLCDWWMTEDECIEKIKESESKRDLNYFTTILLLIRARLVHTVGD